MRQVKTAKDSVIFRKPDNEKHSETPVILERTVLIKKQTFFRTFVSG
jgi:hypothetical protein